MARTTEQAASRYRGVRDRAGDSNILASKAGRDIAPLPEVVDMGRRQRCLDDLEAFLRIYFPGTFRHQWSRDHLHVIERLQRVIESGGRYALAMSRGSGKTSLVERAALWAVLSGRRRFVVPVAANAGLSESMLARLKSELEFNALLLEDFPSAVYPIRRLESQPRRCVGQLFDGNRTCMEWGRHRLVLPTMPGPLNEASGAVVHTAGIGGAVRGLTHVDANGLTIRPDLVLCDDPQDRESARSLTQTAERLQILNADLAGLSGPDQSIAMLATVTVIERGDMADQLLDSAKYPAWQGERYKLVIDWPDRHELWEKYLLLRAEGLQPGGDRAAATAFYGANREEMDRGGVVSWEARHTAEELSAIQHAYNLRADVGDEAFAAEYQNEPVDRAKDNNALDPVQIARRTNGFERGVAPPETEKVTAFIDVGQSILWWGVVGWSENFDGAVLDYGAFPEQRSRIFTQRNASPTIQEVYGSKGSTEASVFAALDALVSRLMTRSWVRSDGSEMALGRLLIDSGWLTDAIRLFIRQNAYRDRLTPSKGLGIGPGQLPIADWTKRTGEKIGDYWALGAAGADRLRLLRIDTNAWKTRVASMLTRPMGSVGGSLTLFGDRPVEHDLIARHLASEFPTRTEAKGNAVNVWARRPECENHLWDVVVGAAVAASMEGLTPLSSIGGTVPKDRVRKKTSFAQLQAARSGARR